MYSVLFLSFCVCVLLSSVLCTFVQMGSACFKHLSRVTSRRNMFEDRKQICIVCVSVCV